MESGKVIHCIGDSHASFFSGYDEIQPVYPEESRNKYNFFKSYRLGAVLAYSLNKLNTKEQGREKLLRLKDELPKQSNLLLCFGEIDCRCHLIKQAEQSGRSIVEVVEQCVNVYFEVIDELIREEFNVIIWNVIPTSDLFNNEYPFYGSHVQRNQCTIIFNEALSKKCIERKLIFISIFDKLLSKNGYTKKTFYFDSIHLGQIAMSYVVQKFIKLLPELYSKPELYGNLNKEILITRLRVARFDLVTTFKKLVKRIYFNKKR